MTFNVSPTHKTSLANVENLPLDGMPNKNCYDEISSIRGGSWANNGHNCKVGIRKGYDFHLGLMDIGFRIARY